MTRGRGDGLLSLMPGWLDNPEAFARPGPPEAEPLPLKFTCAACGEEVHPDARQCSRCREWFSLPNNRNRRFKQ